MDDVYLTKLTNNMPQETLPYTKLKHDGRVKIYPILYKQIRARYKVLRSTRRLAKEYGCSRRLIMFILHPERLEAMKEKNRKEEHWKKYYSTEERKMAMRKYRAKKRKLGFIK